ncbi:decaprenyl-phosphate phosphoribosyltransferase [Legionella adelaidensis]|uniref:decaprenyl-phosphate phosphoribosyltransferase n=1 Tax=Legionella adelaidensis TaxID=45056 RepID=UPI001041759C|nr:decaprenyl-phosphate phosphoribosyltransferase [Legionella adelaidensis]
MDSIKKFYLLLRVSHWTKAIFVLLGVIYSNQSFFWPRAIVAALAFNLIASAVYIYNDLKDIAEDQLHPRKNKRPLASGLVSIPFAVGSFFFLLIVGMGLAFLVSFKMVGILAIYLLINFAYNYFLRNVPVLDVLCIASGFMLRILAGTIGIGLPITWWVTLTATLLSLFIALSKRRLELQLLKVNERRAVLKKYHPRLLNFLLFSTGYLCLFGYVFYIYFVRNWSFYFILTIPFAAFGLYRFTKLTSKDRKKDDPIALFFSDYLSVFNFICFFVLTFLALIQ